MWRLNPGRPVPARRRLAGLHDAVIAGLVGATVSGIPSTAVALLRRADVLEGARAAGAIALPRERRTGVLVAAAVPVHLALSLGWALVLHKVLPRGREPLWGTLAGLAIAALDLGIVGRRLPAIRALDQPPQWLDHAAYGLAVGVTLGKRRLRPAARGRRPDASAPL